MSIGCRLVRLTMPGLMLALPCQALHAQTAITLPPADARLAEEFSVIAGVRELRDGRVLITDEKENRIVAADLRAGTVQPVGRKGSGPGEFTQVVRLWAMGGDSTIMRNFNASGWLVFDGDRIVGTHTGSDPVVTSMAWGRLLGADGSSRLIFAELPSDGNRRQIPDSLWLVRYDGRTARKDTIARVRSLIMPPGTSAAGAERAGGAAAGTRPRYSISMNAMDQFIAFPDGWIAIARVLPYRVDWCAPAGGCTTGPVLQARPVPMTDREKRAHLEMANRLGTWPPTSAIEETSNWLDFVPPFVEPASRFDAGALFASPDGRLLVERLPSAEGMARSYDVVDRRGIVTGRITLPLEERIVGFGARAVYVAVSDSDGLQRLRRHPWR